jgi:hypothetical protein
MADQVDTGSGDPEGRPSAAASSFITTEQSLAAALIVGGVLALLAMLGLMEYQRRAWDQSEAVSRE